MDCELSIVGGNVAYRWGDKFALLNDASKCPCGGITTPEIEGWYITVTTASVRDKKGTYRLFVQPFLKLSEEQATEVMNVYNGTASTLESLCNGALYKYIPHKLRDTTRFKAFQKLIASNMLSFSELGEEMQTHVRTILTVVASRKLSDMLSDAGISLAGIEKALSKTKNKKAENTEEKAENTEEKAESTAEVETEETA